MIKKSDPGLRAPHGEKMIEVKVRFWTNNIAGQGKIVPKAARTAGVVRIERNDAHGIKPRKPLPFNTLAEIPAAIERTLIDHGIVLQPSRKMRKYISNK
jgi:hypothetical protein